MKIQEFHDKKTGTLSYIVFDQDSLDAIIIDPVLNYDLDSKKISNDSFNEITSFIEYNKLNPLFILETHVHADHLSSSQLLKDRFPAAKTAINKNVSSVQSTFKNELALDSNFNTDGRQFDKLLSDGQKLTAGTLNIEVIFTPGHTPACTSFLIGKNLFTGDALFMPDLGTGRCDFPGGSAELLFNSIKNKIYELPDDYNTYTGHDYPPKNRGLKFKATIKDHKENNIHLMVNTSKDAFVKFRTERDAGLNQPKLITPSLKVNLNGGSTKLLASNEN